MRPPSPRILPVCFAAFCLLLIYVFAYKKKNINILKLESKGALEYTSCIQRKPKRQGKRERVT